MAIKYQTNAINPSYPNFWLVNLWGADRGRWPRGHRLSFRQENHAELHEKQEKNHEKYRINMAKSWEAWKNHGINIWKRWKRHHENHAFPCISRDLSRCWGRDCLVATTIHLAGSKATPWWLHHPWRRHQVPLLTVCFFTLQRAALLTGWGPVGGWTWRAKAAHLRSLKQGLSHKRGFFLELQVEGLVVNSRRQCRQWLSNTQAKSWGPMQFDPKAPSKTDPGAGNSKNRDYAWGAIAISMIRTINKFVKLQ